MGFYLIPLVDMCFVLGERLCNVHGSYSARVKHLFAHLWHCNIVCKVWMGSAKDLHDESIGLGKYKRTVRAGMGGDARVRKSRCFHMGAPGQRLSKGTGAVAGPVAAAGAAQASCSVSTNGV